MPEMDLRTAASWARQEMEKHGLEGWRFVWTDAQNQFGVCRYGPREIGLSRVLTEMNGEAEVIDTIRHEIAHALAGHAAGHDWRWERECARVGARPERTYGHAVAVPKYKWTGTCPACGRKTNRRTLFKEARTMACGTCCNGTYDARYLLVWKQNY